jgi:hypothetical protein
MALGLIGDSQVVSCFVCGQRINVLGLPVPHENYDGWICTRCVGILARTYDMAGMVWEE